MHILNYSRFGRRGFGIFVSVSVPCASHHRFPVVVQHHCQLSQSLFSLRAASTMAATTNTASNDANATTTTTTMAKDYSKWSHEELIARVDELERQLSAKNAQYHQVVRSFSSRSAGASSKTLLGEIRNFDPSKYSTRFIALKFAYLGQNYNGYECANGSVTPLPTIEEVMWKALRKGRLISPPSDAPVEVEWDEKIRMQNPSVLNWEGCQYSKCGRTDKGVSAFGQVIGIRVRSNRPLEKAGESELVAKSEGEVQGDAAEAQTDAMEGLPAYDSESEDEPEKTFDPLNDELPYLSILNSVLPRDIRVLAWCPNPPEGFDARFSCGQRRYRYFFTNPAFLPTPGPMGLKDYDGKPTTQRLGYLDIDAMKEGCKNFVGQHDFRNFCKIDESKQMSNCQRRILHADIKEVAYTDGPQFLSQTPECTQFPVDDQGLAQEQAAAGTSGNGPKVYCFEVHGSAFLWHQIRCMVAIIFLIGQRLEKPSLVSELLDIEKNPCKPLYDMAADAPLVLWDCLFPDKSTDNPEDTMEWIYAGDAAGIEAVKTKSDGRFGLLGTLDESWKLWRKRKMDEVLAAGLMDLIASQGDGSSLERGGSRVTNEIPRSQKVFDGADAARFAGKYIPVMQKHKMATLEVQNARWRAGKGSKKLLKKKENEVVESDS